MIGALPGYWCKSAAVGCKHVILAPSLSPEWSQTIAAMLACMRRTLTVITAGHRQRCSLVITPVYGTVRQSVAHALQTHQRTRSELVSGSGFMTRRVATAHSLLSSSGNFRYCKKEAGSLWCAYQWVRIITKSYYLNAFKQQIKTAQVFTRIVIFKYAKKQLMFTTNPRHSYIGCYECNYNIQVWVNRAYVTMT